MAQPRVFLRKLQHEDITQNYLDWFRDNTVTSFLEVDGKSLTRQMVIDYIDKGIDTGEYVMYAICDAESKAHIGNLKVGPINRKHGISDLVCVIGDRNYWGKGYATDAIGMGNQIAFEELDIRKLHGQIYADNIGSIKAYCKAGWIIEGVIKDRYISKGKAMDQVLVSCHNPNYFNPATQTNYNVEKLIELIKFRQSFLS